MYSNGICDNRCNKKKKIVKNSRNPQEVISSYSISDTILIQHYRRLNSYGKGEWKDFPLTRLKSIWIGCPIKREVIAHFLKFVFFFLNKWHILPLTLQSPTSHSCALHTSDDIMLGQLGFWSSAFYLHLPFRAWHISVHLFRVAYFLNQDPVVSSCGAGMP